MVNYTFTVKMSLEDELRPDILEFLIGNAMKTLNVSILTGKESFPEGVEVKGKKN